MPGDLRRRSSRECRHYERRGLFGEVVELSRFGFVFVGLVEPSGRARVGGEQQGDRGRSIFKQLNRAAAFVVGSLYQRPHIGNRVGDAGAIAAQHLGDVVRDDRPVEFHCAQRLHHFVHILIAIVH